MSVFQVTAGSRTTRTNVTVAFQGVNNPPRFPDCGTYTPRVAENQDRDTFVIEVCILAIDVDIKTYTDRNILQRHVEVTMYFRYSFQEIMTSNPLNRF